ncbi:hypothetical protein [Allosphingosinicella deserti]|uniref:hypothetical protein n=1 Tax=Allosphingosinicella deserti TaxID=2116704 RepID=UPI0011B22FD2|nr:hypothetical protein [Sphingomonas deserti]
MIAPTFVSPGRCRSPPTDRRGSGRCGAPDGRHAKRVEMDLSSFRFSRATINLRAGQATLRRLVNS